MELIPESGNLDDYLKETEEIDYSHRLIREKAVELKENSRDETEYVKAAFEFVRDNIFHSWDIQSSRVTRKASEVLLYGEGICYAKANLLCALLRHQGVPAGFCYQKLTLGDTPDSGYAIHALNGVYLHSRNKWIRLDARGNKAGVDAQFSMDEEKLAFPVRAHYDEMDYPTIYVSPNKQTMAVLRQYTNCLELCKYHLPSNLDTAL